MSLTTCSNLSLMVQRYKTALTSCLLYPEFIFKQVVSVPRFRKEMDLYLTWRVDELSEDHIGRLLRQLMQPHLGWVVVWGCVFGALSGIVTQGVRVSLNFNFFS